MSFFTKIFKHKEEFTEPENITFGRYSDSYKDHIQYDAWDKSLDEFENENYLSAYHLFFSYLRDEKENNVIWREENGKIVFELYQGSKKITGTANQHTLKATARIAKAEELSVSLMRRLLEKNFSLKFCRLGIDENDHLLVIFDTYTLDGSPYKLYFALKELAIQADKFDDLLLDEYKELQALDIDHIQDIPTASKEIKYNFLQHKISTVLNEIDNGSLDATKYPSGIGYLLLDLLYKLDYLLKPEGVMMETLERNHRYYFAKEEKDQLEKNAHLSKEFAKMLKRPANEYFKEFYKVRTTFGITKSTQHDRVMNFIDGELRHMQWYAENGHQRVALAIPSFIVGYCLFNYAAPAPDRALFNLFYRITNPAYFDALGFSPKLYNLDKGNFNEKMIKKAIDNITKEHQATFTQLKPDTSSLDFSSLTQFSRTYLLMIRNLDLTTED